MSTLCVCDFVVGLANMKAAYAAGKKGQLVEAPFVRQSSSPAAAGAIKQEESKAKEEAKQPAFPPTFASHQKRVRSIKEEKSEEESKQGMEVEEAMQDEETAEKEEEEEDTAHKKTKKPKTEVEQKSKRKPSSSSTKQKTVKRGKRTS